MAFAGSMVVRRPAGLERIRSAATLGDRPARRDPAALAQLPGQRAINAVASPALMLDHVASDMFGGEFLCLAADSGPVLGFAEVHRVIDLRSSRGRTAGRRQ